MKRLSITLETLRRGLFSTATTRFALVVGLLAAAVTAAILLGQEESWVFRGDNKRLVLPLIADAYHQWMSGSIPGWTTRIWAGYPLGADPTAGAFYPLHWLAFWLTPFPNLQALEVDTALHMGILVAGIIALVGRLGGSRLAALVAAVLLVSSPPLLGWMFWLSRFAGIAWIPWAFVGAEGLSDPARPGGWCAVLASIPPSAQLLSGNPEVAIQTALVVGGWVLVGRNNLSFVQRIGRAAALATAIVLLTSIQVVPTLQILNETIRAVPPERACWATMRVGGATSFFSPDAAAATPILQNAYLGVSTLLLAATAVCLRMPRAWVLALAALVSGLIASNPYVCHWLMDIPVFQLFRHPFKYFVLPLIAVACLSGLGIQAAASRFRRGTAYALLLGMIVIAERVFVIPGILAAPTLAPDLPMNLRSLAAVWPTLAGSEGAGAPQPRVLLDENSWAFGNLPTQFGIDVFLGDPSTPLINVSHQALGLHFPAAVERLTQGTLDLYGVDLIFKVGSCHQSRWPRVRILEHSQGACVYRNTSAGPRLTLLEEVRGVKDSKAMLRAVSKDPLGAVPVVGAAPAVDRPPVGGSVGEIELVRYEPGHIQAVTNSAVDTWLLVREAFSKGWTVRVDGELVPIHPAAGIFFSAQIPTGQHDVEIVYELPGRLLGFVGLAGWFLLAAGVHLRSRDS